MERPWAWRARGSAAAVAAALAVGVGLAAGCVSDAAPAGEGEEVIDVTAAPWAVQADGAARLSDVELQPSLSFAAGVDYADALDALLRSARERGTSPEGTVVMDPLPAEVVYVSAANPGEGLRLSLTAPFGWVPGTGAIRAPSVSMPGSLPPEEVARRIAEMTDTGAALPEGGSVDVPDLPDCAIARGTPDQRPPCG